METHIEGKIYVDTFRWNNVWSFIYRLQYTEINKDFSMYGDSYRGYNVWRLVQCTMYGASYRVYNEWRLI